MNLIKIIPVLISLCLVFSCKKEWLDVKSNQTQVIPTTLRELQGLLDNNTLMNLANGSFEPPVLCEVGTDNYFLETPTWESLPSGIIHQKNAYIFSKEIFDNTRAITAWNTPYSRVFYANVAMEGVAKLEPKAAEQTDWNNIKGSGLFIRSNAYFWLAQLFAKPFSGVTAATDAGIPLRSTADLNEPTVRASVAAVYERIIADTKVAIALLPTSSAYKIRPTKPACYALLARTYLAMADYPNAGLYADSCLQFYSSLMDFKTISTAPVNPIPQFNAEVIYADATTSSLFLQTRARVDTALFASYAPNDLRRTVFFKPATGSRFYSFNGSYDGTTAIFSGVTTSEMYLIRAECLARAGNMAGALSNINALLIKRWTAANWSPLTATDAADALIKILQERRKELCFRGLRWMDLRRLNMEPRFETTVKHVVTNVAYTLPPNDIRYVYPIPELVIQMSGIAQNPR